MSRHSSREDQRPADLWFWDDWFSSIDLKLCSLAAQGLWINLLGFMSRSEIKGALLINGKQISSKDIATLLGKTEAEITPLLEELEAHGVYSKLQDGTVINRRMYREAALRRVRAEAGRLGGKSKKQNESKSESKPQATLEYGNEYESEDESVNDISSLSSKDKEKTDIHAIAAEVVAYLNTKADKSFDSKAKETFKHISARIADGRTVGDFRHVIDVKVAKWKGKSWKGSKGDIVIGDDLLRPSTLFSPTNFENYLNESMPGVKNAASSKFDGVGEEI